jgi:phosphoglycolate phosphatase
MTPPPPDPDPRLADVIRVTRHLFLDFDGPICSIFAGLKPETVAEKLRDVLTSQDIQLPADVAATADPFDVFTYAATISPALAAAVETTMTALELAAVPTAEPTAYVHEVIAAARESGRTLTIVSNNSARAVHAYLAHHALDGPIGTVIARTTPDPTQLKPSRHLLDLAITANNATPPECTLLGDQATDIIAAHQAGTHNIAYANKPAKTEHLTNAGADAVITSLAHLALALRARPRTDL